MTTTIIIIIIIIIRFVIALSNFFESFNIGIVNHIIRNRRVIDCIISRLSYGYPVLDAVLDKAIKF